MRRILAADRDGKYVAIDNPDAVVVDHGAQMIRANLDRWPVSRPQHWRFLAHMLTHADTPQHRTAIGESLGNANVLASSISGFARSSEMIFSELGMVLETLGRTGCYRLHTEPRETLECCKTLAPGQPLPWRLLSTPGGRGTPRTTCAKSRRRSTTFMGAPSGRPSR